MPNRLRSLMKLPKRLSTPATWSIDRGKFVFSTPLIVMGNQPGLQLRGRCSTNLPDQDLTFQIEYYFQHSSAWGPLTRFDWRPHSPHTNQRIGPKHLHSLTILSSHIHPFTENWDWIYNNPDEFTLENLKKENLPIAEKLDLASDDVPGAIAVMGEKFHIENIDGMIPHPPWQS